MVAPGGAWWTPHPITVQATSRTGADRSRTKNRWSRPISRVLSRTTIHLGRPSPDASCDLPGDTCGPQAAKGMPPYLVLLQRGFTVPPPLPETRCALTTPFHPYLTPERIRCHRRFAFCCTFRRLTSPRRYLASRPAEPGLSSAALRRPRSSGRLRVAPYGKRPRLASRSTP